MALPVDPQWCIGCPPASVAGGEPSAASLTKPGTGIACAFRQDSVTSSNPLKRVSAIRRRFQPVAQTMTDAQMRNRVHSGSNPTPAIGLTFTHIFEMMGKKCEMRDK